MAAPPGPPGPLPETRATALAGKKSRASARAALSDALGRGARDTSEEEEGEGDQEEEEEEEEEEEGKRATEGQSRRRRRPDAQKSPRKKKKKQYHRHTKPPYTYLAMIALVIQAAPERKLKLSQIIKEISNLFPFFKEGYQGWKDSVRHNLSSNDCFHKVLKDPTKPKAKGNFWTVDLDRVPPEALRLQNTPISRQEEGLFAADLGPYVLHGLPLDCSPAACRVVTASEGSSGFSTAVARRPSPFSIDSLLSDFQDVGLCGKPGGAGREGPPPRRHHHQPAASLDFWGTVPILCVSAGQPVLPWRPSCPPPALRSFSSSSSLSSLSSLSAQEGEVGRPRAKKGRHPNLPAKRPRGLLNPNSSSSDSESSRSWTPPPLAPQWEQLPTSYTKSVAPNVVAPPSYSPPFTNFPSLPSLSFRSPPAVALAGPVGWEVTPGRALTPAPPPQLTADLDQAMPPNKTVYDVWMTHPSDTVHPAVSGPGPCFPGGVVAPYDPSWEEP